MGIPQGWEFIILLLVLLLLFGAKRLPDTARGLGRSLRIFKAETKGLRDDDDRYETRETRTETRAIDPRADTRIDPRADTRADDVQVTRTTESVREVREPHDR